MLFFCKYVRSDYNNSIVSSKCEKLAAVSGREIDVFDPAGVRVGRNRKFALFMAN